MRSARTFALVFALIAGGCQRGPDPAGSASSSAPAASLTASDPPLASSGSPDGAGSLLAGKWKGSFAAKAHPIEMTREEGAVPSWSKDPGTEAAGSGSLELEISRDGLVTGSAKGPLGELQASGAAEEDGVRVQLLPLEPAGDKAFTGHVVLSHAGGRLSGVLQASSGDSLTVRAAQVELSRVR